MIIQSSKENRFRAYSGKLIKDPEFSTFGKNSYSKANLAVAFEGERIGGIINVQALFELADMCRGLQKHDWVMVAGSLSSYESREGKTRWYLECESIYPDIRTMSRLMAAKSAAPMDVSGFTELAEDGEEPF